MDLPHHSIRTAALMSGLTAHVIRVWERRYRAVEPVRTPTNRRLYPAEAVERLTLLRRATGCGCRIGTIARLPTDALRQLVATLPAAVRTMSEAGPTRRVSSSTDFEPECLEAVRRMDGVAFEAVLTRALIELGLQGLLCRVVGPFAQTIGELWERGQLSAAHEHFASAVIRAFLGTGRRPPGSPETAPLLVVSTPAGQVHELGALMAAALAGNLGWRVHYLGPNLPAAELAGAAIQQGAQAVALSLVYPPDDRSLPVELTALRRFLPPEIRILVGGRAATAYREVLNSIGALQSEDLLEFGRRLDELRQAPAPAATA